MDRQETVSIIIPLYNEKHGLDTLFKEIEEYYAKRKFDFEIVFVNDGSTDGTGEILSNKKSLPYKCTLINFSKNFGAHAAVRAGFVHSKNTYATSLPADLQISFDAVETIYFIALEGYDVVFGVREANESGIIEKTFSRLYAFMMQRFVSKDFPFKGLETLMINDKVRKIFNNNIESNSSVFLQVISMGFKSKYADIEKVQRKIGESKWTISKKIKLLIDSFVAFSYAPIRFVSLTGILFFTFGLLWTVYIIARKIIYDDLATGWPALTSILLLGFGVTNIGLGIIAEYLWRTLDASRKRPVFIIDEVVELNK
jgi:dolichol-phosphate mannosyltransferase